MFTLFDYQDGTSVTIDPNGEVNVTFVTGSGVGGTRVLRVEGEELDELGDDQKLILDASRDTMWLCLGDLSQVNEQMKPLWRKHGSHWTPMVEILFNLAGGTPPGEYFFTVRFLNADSGASESFILNVRIVARVMFATPCPWVPREYIDLQWDIGLDAILSSGLNARARLVNTQLQTYVPAISAGAEPMFAMVLFLNGAVIVADVTELSIVIRESNKFDEPVLIEAVGDDDDFVSTVPYGYYGLQGELKSEDLQGAFLDRNSEEANANEPDRTRALPCIAQVCVTYDGRKYVSPHFDLLLLQPADDALLE